MEMVARAARTDAARANGIREAIRSGSPNKLRFRVIPLESQLEQLDWRRRANLILLTGLAILSLLLTTLGLYALVHYAVLQRTAEIGLRIALGAALVSGVTRELGVFAGVALVVTLMVVVAACGPALAAARTDPVRVLN